MTIIDSDMIERELNITSNIMQILTQKNLIIKEEDENNVFSIAFCCKKVFKKITIICRIKNNKKLILITIY